MQRDVIFKQYLFAFPGRQDYRNLSALAAPDLHADPVSATLKAATTDLAHCQMLE